MIAAEQARAADERILAGSGEEWADDADNLARYVLAMPSRREQPDDDPISAEWCRENGGESCDETDCYGNLLPRYRWEIGRVSIVVDLWSDGVVDVRVCRTNWRENPTRSQLLALLAALRGEPSENPG